MFGRKLITEDWRLRFWSWVILIITVTVGGCAPLHRGACLPQELSSHQLAQRRNTNVTIDFRYLEGPQPPEHIIGPADVLGVYIADVLGQRDQLPHVTYPSFRLDRDPVRPFVGHPIPVETDGTIHLPFIHPLHVDGMTMLQAKEVIRRAYSTDRQIIEPGRENIQVSLITSRAYRIHVFRQDTRYNVPGLQNSGQFEISRRWSGTTLLVSPKDATVMSALDRTGGLPGIDARNEIWVMKGVREDMLKEIGNSISPIEWKLEGYFPLMLPKHDSKIIRIPLSHPVGDPLPFELEDCQLGDGDVVFLPQRKGDHYLTGGLLPAGRIPLDRDRDLDILEAIAKAQGNALETLGQSSSRFTTGPGGVCPPTEAIVIRRLHEQEQFKIKVDLRKALEDSSERLLIAPGDLIIVQYRPHELMTNILLNFFDFNVTLRGLQTTD